MVEINTPIKPPPRFSPRSKDPFAGGAYNDYRGLSPPLLEQGQGILRSPKHDVIGCRVWNCDQLQQPASHPALKEIRGWLFLEKSLRIGSQNRPPVTVA